MKPDPDDGPIVDGTHGETLMPLERVKLPAPINVDSITRRQRISELAGEIAKRSAKLNERLG